MSVGGQRKLIRLLPAIILALLAASFPTLAGPHGSTHSNKNAALGYAPDRIIIKLASAPEVAQGPKGEVTTKLSSVDKLNTKFGAKHMRPVFRRASEGKHIPRGLAGKLDGIYTLTFSAKADPRDVAREYSKLAEVEYAEPDYIRSSCRIDPNDPYWLSNNSWGQNYRDQWDLEMIKCPDAWDIETGDSGTVIAVIDTGIDYLHADIAANMWVNPGEIPGNGIDDDSNGRVDDIHGYDFAYKDNNPMDGNGHGTHVAGTIGAVGNNGIGISGINWSCKLMAVKGLNDSGDGYDSDLADAIIYAVTEGADIINMSWGGSGFSQTIHQALAYAHSQGVVLCAAAGNSASDLANFHPASDNFVIAVTASDTNDEACSFTNWGIRAAVSAPGGNGNTSPPQCALHNCLSLRAGTTDPLQRDCGAGVGIVGGAYYRLAGTSMACPHVSGLAGLVKAANPSWSNEQIRQAIQMRADDVRSPGFDRYTGYGRINAYSTLTSPEPMTALITSPDSGSEVSGIVSIEGTAAGPNFSQWVLDYGPGQEPATWTTIATGLAPVTRGVLADWDVTSITGALYTLRLRVTGAGGVQNAEYRMAITPKSTEGSGHFTELFDTAPFDLAYKSLEFVPNGSQSFYSMCVRPISQLPTSPTGGAVLSLDDDDYAVVTLAGGAQVSLYGNVRNQFYVGSNGYITFDSGDDSYLEALSSHFGMKRISALFDDLVPSPTSVTWKQLSDRVAVTYADVTEYGTTTQSTFQIEMYFDGRIVLSYLNVAASDGLSGLSAGLGIPSGFVESDLSGYPGCVIAGRALTVVKPNGGECYEPGTTARIVWSYSGNAWKSVDKVRIEYSANSGSTWAQITGAENLAYNAGAFDWQTTGYPQSTSYRIRIVYNDDPTVKGESNADFTVGPDTVAPVIVHTPLTDTVLASGPYQVYADVTDNLGVASATLYWKRNNGSFTAVPMEPAGGTGRYVADIPGPSVVGDTYCYYLEAVDSSSAHNVGRLPVEPGQSFCFSIIKRTDYLTQLFDLEPFDLRNMCVEFIPDGSDDFYSVCAHPISGLPTDPTHGTLIPLGDDNSIQINLTQGAMVSLYGEARSSFYVGSNGYITFDTGDFNWESTLSNHFAFKRISALFADLIPNENVSYRQLGDRVAVTYQGVREYGMSNSNTFQIEMFYDGKIAISYGMVESSDCLVGLSAGNGMPIDYVESDMSAYPCVPRLTIVTPDGGEFYEPGSTIPIKWTAIGNGWQFDDTVRLEASSDGGSTWSPIPGAQSLPYNHGTWIWNTSGWALSANYRVRIVSNTDPGVTDASDGDFSIAVDVTPPVVTHTPLSDTNNTDGPYTVSVQITDNLGVGVVTLYWSRNGGVYTPVPMVPVGVGGEYRANIPGPSVSCTDSYCYYITARDSAAVPNLSRSPASGQYCFNIAGAAISVSHSSLTFETPPDGTDSRQITLTNNGCVPLQWQIMERAASEAIFDVEAEQAPIERPAIDWSAPHVPGRLIVGIEQGMQSGQRAGIHAQAGAKVVHSFSLVSADVVKVDVGTDLKAVAAKYAGMPGVTYVEPDYILSAADVPDDPMFSQLWGLHNTGQTGGTADADIDAPEAWDICTGDRSVVVGVIDSGVCYTHPDLAPNMWVNVDEVPNNGVDDDGNGYIDDVYGYDFANNDSNPMDDYEHGTHVAGILGAVGNNGLGVTGVNWNVRIMALKFLRADGYGDTSDAVKCIEYAVSNGATLTCNSWGGGAYSQTLVDAITAADQAGQLFVAAAGNSAVDTDASPSYPSCYSVPNIISVAATDHNDNLAVWPSGGGSNWGRNTVDLAAPGLGVVSTVPAEGYASKNGTSMATPYVAGACALCISINPTATKEQIKHWILSGVDQKPSLADKTLTGGRLNVYNSAILAGISWLDETPKEGVIPPGESRNITVTVDATGLNDGFIGTGDIAIRSNDYSEPTLLIPVTLNVVLTGRFLRIDTPNGGEWYQPGSIVPIRWTPIGTDWQPTDLLRLEYSSDGGATWAQVPGADAVFCSVGSFNWNTAGCPQSFKYRVRAVFVYNENVRDTSDADFTIAADTVPPVITHSPLADSGDMSGPYTIYAGVTDNYAVGSVTLYWRRNGGSFAAVPMTAVGTGNQYSAQIPGPSSDGDRYCYYIRAVDASVGGNVTLEPAGAPAQLHCFITRSVVPLPITMNDGDGFRWDIQQNGGISDGSNDAFDGGFILAGFPNMPTGGLEDGGREIIIDNGATTGIRVSRKVYVPSNHAYCRFLEVVTNLGASATNYTVRIDTNLGSDAGTVIVGTSDGDSLFETIDQWIVTDDADGSGDPVVTHVIAGPGAAQIPSATSTYPIGTISYTYDLSLNPQETKIIMHFGAQGTNRAAALDKAAQIASLSAAQDCLSGMTSAERSRVVNFTIVGRSLDVVNPNGEQWFEPGSVIPIIWASAGSDWQSGDTVRIEASSDGGATWAPIPGAGNLAYDAGSFNWDTTGVVPSDQYRVRVTWNGSDSVRDVSDSIFVIAPDDIAPMINLTPLEDTNNLEGPYRVCAGVYDNLGVGSVTLYWSKNGGAFNSLPMSESGEPGWYCADIPGPSVDGDRYCYYIAATDSSAAGNVSVEPAGAPGQTHCFAVRHIIGLPITLYDSESFTWDIQRNGSILVGTNDAFDGAFVLNGFPEPATGQSEDGDREIVISDGASSGIRVTRKIYVPADRAYARFLEVVTNNSDSAAVYTVRIDTNMGSDSETVVAGTSDGDTDFETTDRWIITDDADGVGDPTLTHVVAGAAAPQLPSMVSRVGDTVRYEYALELGPHETQIVMHFGVQSHTRASALTKAPQLALVNAVQNPLSGMTATERSQVVNFITEGMVLQISSPNGGERYLVGETVPIRWDAVGPDWKAGDTVRIEVSPDDGATWSGVPGAGSLAYNAGSFDWDTTGAAGSGAYRVRIVRNGEGSVADSSDGSFSIAVFGSARDCKLNADGVPVTVNGRRVSAVFDECFYVQEEDRSCGIGVRRLGPKPAIGDIADVSGAMITVDGERMIDADSVTWSDPDSLVPTAVGMSGKGIGGGPLEYLVGPPPTGQRGVLGKIGLNNIGLLVKTWGKVVSVDPSPTPAFFTMTDGFDQLLVDLAPGIAAPEIDDKVSVTGISSCYTVGNDLRSRIRLRGAGDLVIQVIE